MVVNIVVSASCLLAIFIELKDCNIYYIYTYMLCVLPRV